MKESTMAKPKPKQAGSKSKATGKANSSAFIKVSIISATASF